MMHIAPAHLSQDLDSAMRQHGIRSRRIELISPLRERKGARFAYRVDTLDGKTLKLRHCGDVTEATRLRELRADLEDAFARVLAQYGPVLIEEWIDGVLLSDSDERSWVQEAGAILGRLHSRSGTDGPRATATTQWREAARSDLQLLGESGVLTPSQRAAVSAELARRDPRRARRALIHRDFCTENMIIDDSGRLHIIDNELLLIGPCGFDLGLTFHRWPMSQTDWTRFLFGYRQAAPTSATDATIEALGFFKIAAALMCCRVFFQRMPLRLDASIAALLRLVDEEVCSELASS